MKIQETSSKSVRTKTDSHHEQMCPRSFKQTALSNALSFNTENNYIKSGTSSFQVNAQDKNTKPHKVQNGGPGGFLLLGSAAPVYNKHN